MVPETLNHVSSVCIAESNYVVLDMPLPAKYTQLLQVIAKLNLLWEQHLNYGWVINTSHREQEGKCKDTVVHWNYTVARKILSKSNLVPQKSGKWIHIVRLVINSHNNNKEERSHSKATLVTFNTLFSFFKATVHTHCKIVYHYWYFKQFFHWPICL